jgi:hypothetical protein
VSHETIYLTLFIQARGGLKRELAKHLRNSPGEPAARRVPGRHRGRARSLTRS